MPSTEARRMSAYTESRVGTLSEVLVDLTSPLGDRVRRGSPDSSIIVQLGDSLREIRDTWGVTKEAMAGIVPESWLEWGLGAEGDKASRPPEADLLPAHDAVTTNFRKAQQKLGKLVRAGTPRTQLLRIRCRRRHARRDRTTRWGGEAGQGLHHGSIQVPRRGRSHRMPSSAPNGLAPSHTRSRVRRN